MAYQTWTPEECNDCRQPLVKTAAKKTMGTECSQCGHVFCDACIQIIEFEGEQLPSCAHCAEFI